MSLFGLGSFGEGFVTGFATEANEALKKSVKRINTRVDKLKDFQVQRAIKEQDKRASEVEEHKEALQQAYALFDGDENAEQAIAYAGGLLKERGGLAAFKTKIAELQKAKDNGTNIFNYFERATTDAPFNATLDDIANAAVGGRSTTATDYRLPEGMGDDSSLVGTILGKKIDIVGMAMEQSSQEIGALYGASVDQLVSLPTITFKSEEFSLSSKTPAEILDYANKKLATPSVRDNPEAVTRYEAMRDAQEKAVVATKDQQAMLNIVNAQINRLPLDQKGTDAENNLLQKRQEIKDSIKLTSLEGDPVGILEHRKTIALRNAVAKAQESGKPVDMTEVEALTEKINTLSGVVKTEAEEVAEDREALNKRTDPTYTGLDKIDTSTPEGQALYEKEINLINAREAVLNQNVSEKPVDAREVTFFQRAILDGLEDAKDKFLSTLDLNTRTTWNRITNQIAGAKDPIAQLARLELEDPEGVKTYREVELAREKLRPNFIANYLKPYNRKLNPELFSAAAGLGYVEPEDQAAVSETVSSGQDASAQTAAALDIKTADDVKKEFPDTVVGAKAMINTVFRKGLSIQDAVNMAEEDKYSEDFINTLKAELEQDSAVAKMAIEDAGMEGEPDSDVTYATSKQVSALDVIRKMPILQQGSQNLKIRTLSSKLDISQDEAKNILESLDSAIYSPQDEVKIAKDIVDSIIGTDYRETKAIAKELNIPMDYARRLHKQVTGNSASTGGLMARK